MRYIALIVGMRSEFGDMVITMHQAKLLRQQQQQCQHQVPG